MEAAAVAVERLARLAKRPAASVRVSAPPALAAYVIAPRLAAFQRAHPDVTIALDGAAGAAALDRGEADVAVRMGKPEETGLVVKRIGRARFALYAAPEVARAPRQAWRFIGFDAALDRVTSQQWLKALAGKRELAFRASDRLQPGAGGARRPRRRRAAALRRRRRSRSGRTQRRAAAADPGLLAARLSRRPPRAGDARGDGVSRRDDRPRLPPARTRRAGARLTTLDRSRRARSCPWRGRSRAARGRAADWRR